MRRFGEVPQLARQTTSVVLGSAANGLGAGVGLHAELRALQGAGLDPEHVLRTAGINAASALGLGLQVGRVAPGASADIVLVDGDPLANVLDAPQGGRCCAQRPLLQHHRADRAGPGTTDSVE